MQAIAGLSRSISRAFLNGVVQRSQSTEVPNQASDADTRLGNKDISFFFILFFFSSVFLETDRKFAS